MSDKTELTSQIQVKVDGAVVQKNFLTNLVEVVVEQSTHLPNMFTIRLFDTDLKLLDEGPFNLTKPIEISAETADHKKIILMDGEITALEPEFHEGMTAELVVRGYDKSHRLFRETKSKTFLNVKDSDLVADIAGTAGLTPKVETTTEVYEHIFQHNQSDLAFLMQRAWRIGYECFVEEGKLHFRKPPASPEKVELTWGQEMLSFMPRMTLAEQVDEVKVQGWDVMKKEAIVGEAKQGNLYAKVKESQNGADWASSFGAGKRIIVDQPVVSQEEANTLAAARLDEISGAFVEADGEAFRRPDICAGKMVSLRGLGKRFSGDYLVTSTVHRFTMAGLTTNFTVRGARTGVLTEQLVNQEPLERWSGVVPAIVTNTDDPNDWARVKVKFPWMSEEEESDWARIVSAGAGPEAGCYLVPDVDDEVMVTFIHGDFSQPIVLGGVWNGKNKLPKEAVDAPQGEKPLVRTWHSRTGHKMVMYDTSDNKIEIVTADGSLSLVLDEAGQKLTIHCQGDIEIEADKNIKLKAGQDLEMESGTNAKLKAGSNLDLEAASNGKLKAGANLDAEAGVAGKFKAGASLDIDGGPMTNVKGGMIKLN